MRHSPRSLRGQFVETQRSQRDAGDAEKKMSRLFACLVSDVDGPTLVSVARSFAHSIEMIDDGVLFDVSGLGRLIGRRETITKRIVNELRHSNIQASVAVAETVDTAMLLARRQRENQITVHSPQEFSQLPLRDLEITEDTLDVFTDLGLKRVDDLLAVPREELIGRYGQDFMNVIDTIEQRSASFVVANIKENHASWSFDLDQPVEDFEQLIFVLNHGLERLLKQIAHCGHSTEHLDLDFGLRNKTQKAYEIKTSFPTLDRNFWLKLINLRAALDPPEAEIVTIHVTAHFTRPRPAQRGLYAVSRPEPESLLLTVNKLKKLVGQENVGIPVLLDQRMSEPFGLDAEAIPEGKECIGLRVSKGGIDTLNVPPLLTCEPMQQTIGFTYYRPPVSAEVLVRDKRLVYIKSRQFAGHITDFSGVWKGNAKWWDEPWKTLEWDIEVENAGVYRLCKVRDEWFLVGEYD
jgi:protein ImuB